MGRSASIKIAILVYLTLVCSVSSAVEGASPRKKFKLLVIHSYLPGIWTTESTQGIRSALRERGVDFEIDDYIFDYYSYIHLSAPNQGKVKAQVFEKITQFQPDLIFVFDDEAADSLLVRLNELKIPIVVSGINKTENQVKWWKRNGAKDRHFTGVWERYPFSQSLRMLKRLTPKVTQISILTGDNDSAKVISGQLEDFFRKSGGTFSGIHLEHTFMSSKWREWQETIKTYKGEHRAFWIVSPWNINDESGKEVDLRKIGHFYHTHSILPTLAIVSVNQQLGFLASFAVSSEDLGYQAGELALRILVKKVDPSSIPFEETKTIRFVINKEPAEKLGYKIPLDLLEFAKIEKKIPMKFIR